MSKVVRPTFLNHFVLNISFLLVGFGYGSSSAADVLKGQSDLKMPFSLAVNIGGPAHSDAYGVAFAADQSTEGQGKVTFVEGAQDPLVYTSFREGDLEFSAPVPSQAYALTLYFTEPVHEKAGHRIFDVVVEEQTVVKALDIIDERDGNPQLALTRTIPYINVEDGQFNLALRASVGEGVLSGFYLRAIDGLAKCSSTKWEEHFDGTYLNEDFWNYELWPAGKVNGELQRYTRDSKNVRLEDGKLILQAHYDNDDQSQFSSARVHTADKVDFQYGRIEVSAKVAKGKGIWPAIWMLPTEPFKHATTCGPGTDWQGNGQCDAWPNSGEIDIMEHVGYDPRRVHATVHTHAYYWVKGTQRKGSVELHYANETFHVYAVDWSPERMDFSVNGVRYFSYLKTQDDWRAWPFDAEFHLILNLAVGGGWGGAKGPPDLSAFPAQFEIDYVKVYDQEACNYDL